MTQHQYRVIADRDKGDDPQNWDRVEDGDRVVVTHSDGEFWPTRIERPVPTADAPKCDCGAPLAVCTAAFRGTEHSPSLPTREQIAEAIYAVRAGSKQNWHKAAFRDDYLKEADAVLALLHKGADR